MVGAKFERALERFRDNVGNRMGLGGCDWGRETEATPAHVKEKGGQRFLTKSLEKQRRTCAGVIVVPYDTEECAQELQGKQYFVFRNFHAAPLLGGVHK